MITYTIIAYIIYLWVCLGLTIWVSHVLFKNARVFFTDIFPDNDLMADSVNHLLKIGFYLINFGLIFCTVNFGTYIDSTKELFEATSVKIGTITLMLGAMHFMNVYLFFKLRKERKKGKLNTENGDHPYFGPDIKTQLATEK